MLARVLGALLPGRRGLPARSLLAQAPASRVLFRVFLSDGRVLSSYGEWARLDDRVIFSMPTQLSREPVELHLITIPVAARRLAAHRDVRGIRARRRLCRDRGDADFAVFSSEVAKTLNEVAKIADPRERLATAERARQKLADWPAAHYGYRIGEVREALGRARRGDRAAARRASASRGSICR